MEKVSSKISKFLITLISIYQIIISPFLKSSCKFKISCSNYSIIVIQNFGLLKGLYMTLIRLINCQSFLYKKY